ncbi:MAG: hypothetical protein CK426_00390 [Legionella sp.]|nr:MAG: hypothetical protein CK423_09095 [Legionella sp.]PJE00129.1 MAG: hypothetical protein CK426_00390 [Legionella sp.]
MFNYTAKIYFDTCEIKTRSGNQLNELYVWMLAQVQGKFGNLHGQIINNKTHLIEKEFRSCPGD